MNEQWENAQQEENVRTMTGALASMGMFAGLLVGGLAAPAHAADTAAPAQDCELIQSSIYTGANLFGYAQGLDGCSGDVSYEILGSNSQDGPFEVVRSGTRHYDDEEVSHWEDSATMPCYAKIRAEFEDQEITTSVARNNNCSG